MRLAWGVVGLGFTFGFRGGFGKFGRLRGFRVGILVAMRGSK